MNRSRLYPLGYVPFTSYTSLLLLLVFLFSEKPFGLQPLRAENLGAMLCRNMFFDKVITNVKHYFVLNLSDLNFKFYTQE